MRKNVLSKDLIMINKGGSFMRNKGKSTPAMVFFSLFIAVTILHAAWAQDYKALEGLENIRAVFDFRDGDPEIGLAHLRLVHETYRDKNIRKVTEKPEFVVVFMGSSPRLLTNKREAFSPEERKLLQEFDTLVAEMSKEGIGFEVCMEAVEYAGVDPESISPDIKRVRNGWISSIGYQAKGYSMIPAF
jgi:intracellular sulfur oxidation DsrE/DsrF family protein